MDLKTKKVGNVIEVFLAGRLDVQISMNIENEIQKIIHKNPTSHLLMNLGEIKYMSSSGIRIFVSTMRVLKETERMLRICNMSNEVRRVFKIVELLDMFDVFENEEEAIDSFKESIH